MPSTVYDRSAMIAWSGIFHILATPFRQDGALDVREVLVEGP